MPTLPGGMERETSRIVEVGRGLGALAINSHIVTTRAKQVAGSVVHVLPYPWMLAYANSAPGVANVNVAWEPFGTARIPAGLTMFTMTMAAPGVALQNSAIILPNDDAGMTFVSAVGVGGLFDLTVVGLDDFWQAMQALRIAATAAMAIGSGGGLGPIPTPPA